MVSTPLTKLRGCTPRETQPATFDTQSATCSATEAQPGGLKAAALRVLERNSTRNQVANIATAMRNSGAIVTINDDATREAVEERAAILEYEGGLTRTQAETVADLFKAFYDHLMGPRKIKKCCYAPAGRFCPEGQRLRDGYYGACS